MQSPETPSAIDRWVKDFQRSRSEAKHSKRDRSLANCNVHIEEFPTREERDDCYGDLKAMGIPNLVKTTTQREGKIVWQLVRP